MVCQRALLPLHVVTEGPGKLQELVIHVANMSVPIPLGLEDPGS